MKFLTAIILFAIIIWSAEQKYLFITAVFPIASYWLGYIVLILGITLVITVIIRQKEKV